MPRKSAWEWITVVAAALLALGSWLPWWARIHSVGSGSFELIAGPSEFTVWDAYPGQVLVGIVVAVAVVGLGVVHLLSGKPESGRGYIYAVSGAVALVSLVYGVLDGPSALFIELPRFGPGEFAIDRGPMLYFGLALAIVMAIGGALTQARLPRPVSKGHP